MPSESVDQPEEDRFDPAKVLQTLARWRVEYLVIGGVAATLHGSPYPTNDIDICPARNRNNLAKLARALEEMDARVHAPDAEGGLAFPRDAEMLDRAEMWNLITRFGRFDISLTPSGTSGYEDLARDAASYCVGGINVRVASLADVIRSKEAAGRERDRQVLPTLRKLLERSRED